MPSNQTANYQLSQWSKDDLVLMDDFNADNAKIDAAVKAVDQRVDGLSSGKADASTVTALTQTLSGKADASTVTALTQTVNGKADASTVTALTQTVNGKADASTVTALTQTVNGKADASTVTALTQTVNGKGNCRIVTGTYAGGGTTEKSLDFAGTLGCAPKLLFVRCSGALGQCLCIMAGMGASTTALDYNSYATDRLGVTWTATGVSWRCTGGSTSPGIAFNASGLTYYYVAFA